MTHIDRAEAVKRIKTALRTATGRSWRVYGDRGTAWGWLTIRAPQARSTNKYGYMSDEDCKILGDIFYGGLRLCHMQGYDVRPESREWVVETAEAAAKAAS